MYKNRTYKKLTLKNTMLKIMVDDVRNFSYSNYRSKKSDIYKTQKWLDSQIEPTFF